MEASLVLLTADQARSLTEEVKQDAQRLWLKLLDLYEGQAHLALGYSSWGKYFTAEFGQSGKQGYYLLDAGRVVRAIEEAEPVKHASLALPNQRQATELIRLDDDPTMIQEVWEEVLSTHENPTAKDVKEAVQERVGPTTRRAGIVGEANKRKLYAALSGIHGFCRGLDTDINYEALLDLADQNDLMAWNRTIKEAHASLRRLSNELTREISQ